MESDTNIEFSISLEKTRQEILTLLLSICEFENTFQDKLDKSIKLGKEGFWLTHHEYRCTVDLYRSLHARLLFHFESLNHITKHLELQKSILEKKTNTNHKNAAA